MSAFISLATDDRIEIAIDGALYLPDGRLMGVKKKGIALPEVPAAIFGRGADGIVGTLAHLTAITSPMADIAGEPNGYDDLVKRVEHDLAPKVRAQIEAAGGIPDEAQSEIGLAGFLKAAGPCVCLMRTFPITIDHGEGDVERLEPWKLYRMPPFYTAGPDITEDIRTMGVSWDDLCRDGLRPYALDLMTAMRKRADVNPFVPDAAPIYGVGGHVQFLTVTRDDARSEILHVWNDPIGEFIDPFRTAA